MRTLSKTAALRVLCYMSQTMGTFQKVNCYEQSKKPTTFIDLSFDRLHVPIINIICNTISDPQQAFVMTPCDS